jgi:hypothetical protein
MNRVRRVAEIVLGFVLVAIGVLWLLFCAGVALLALGFGSDAAGWLRLLAWTIPGFVILVIGSLTAFHAASRDRGSESDAVLPASGRR